ncbi:hypothetical protein Salat_2621300 [Sesamum alatum]|uniref:Uncharacterized protein n=1 Tax=Sesamum alatum TaxID=300844 RepID=A0AAE1XPJ9_9LAMI|nr:hypothetical protein Salat_2621300 [Sesamum alatum]
MLLRGGEATEEWRGAGYKKREKKPSRNNNSKSLSADDFMIEKRGTVAGGGGGGVESPSQSDQSPYTAWPLPEPPAGFVKSEKPMRERSVRVHTSSAALNLSVAAPPLRATTRRLNLLFSPPNSPSPSLFVSSAIRPTHDRGPPPFDSPREGEHFYTTFFVFGKDFSMWAHNFCREEAVVFLAVLPPSMLRYAVFTNWVPAPLPGFATWA